MNFVFSQSELRIKYRRKHCAVLRFRLMTIYKSFVAVLLVLMTFPAFSQDTVIVDDGSIWFQRNRCDVDPRCYDNIDELIAMYCNDSTTVLSLQLRENVYEKSTERLSKCRVESLVDYLRQYHDIEIEPYASIPTLLTMEQMQWAVRNNKRAVVTLIFGPKPEE